nr:anthrone oxygenase family protein [uncultured Sphingobacterium sp.]
MKTQELLAVTTILSGLMSGFFFAYTFSVNLGLAKLNNKEYLTTMQSINKEVLNPIFYISFFGTLFSLVISSIIYFDIHSPKFFLIFISCISYIIGVFGITAIRNVPLNNQIELFDISKASEESVQKMRATFEKPWLFWNNIRTLASFVTFACLVIALACLNH